MDMFEKPTHSNINIFSPYFPTLVVSLASFVQF